MTLTVRLVRGALVAAGIYILPPPLGFWGDNAIRKAFDNPDTGRRGSFILMSLLRHEWQK
jgi:hypothetical protein